MELNGGEKDKNKTPKTCNDQKMGGEMCEDKIAWNNENSHGGTNFEERNATTVVHHFAGTNL